MQNVQQKVLWQTMASLRHLLEPSSVMKTPSIGQTVMQMYQQPKNRSLLHPYTQCQPAANSESNTLADWFTLILRAGLTTSPASRPCARCTAAPGAACFIASS